MERAIKTAKTLWLPSILLTGAFGLFATIGKSGQEGLNPLGLIITILAVVVLLGGLLAQRSGKTGWAFGLGVTAMAAVSAVIFVLLFPNVMVSSTDPAYNLTIYNAASSAKTLEIMSFVVLFFLPIVLGYQAYNYWVFRKRLTTKSEDLHY
jgi:cytochrome d ubiquinol oxidase subunit II